MRLCMSHYSAIYIKSNEYGMIKSIYTAKQFEAPENNFLIQHLIVCSLLYQQNFPKVQHVDYTT